MKPFCLVVALVASTLAAPGLARANFCKNLTSERARTEAQLLEAQTFSKTPAGASVDYVGDRAYNSDIISCNRERDSNGNDVDKAIDAAHTFASQLERRVVKGHYWYYATVPLAYAYELRRD